MTHLSVNINKIALLRNARGENIPNVLTFAQDCERFGAQGITVHPRQDERHIRKSDVYELKQIVKTEFNIEGYPSNEFLDMVREVKPDQCTLVPDPPEALTSNTGWDTITHKSFLTEVIASLHEKNIRTSLFIDPQENHLEAAKESGTDRIEFYTGPYAKEFSSNQKEAIYSFRKASEIAKELNLGINAGHDLNLNNLEFFANNIVDLLEVSIGHALVRDCLYFGLENTIQLYLRALAKET